MADSLTIPAEVDALLRSAVDIVVLTRTLREYLAVQDGGGATVVRIEEVQRIFGWQNDPPIATRRKTT